MDEFGVYYVKWYMEKKTNTVYYLYVKSKKYSTLVNVTRSWPTDRESKLVVMVAKEERQYRSGEWEAQNIGCMILYNMGNVANILQLALKLYKKIKQI